MPSVVRVWPLVSSLWPQRPKGRLCSLKGPHNSRKKDDSSAANKRILFRRGSWGRDLDVFGENDPARRRAVIDEIFTEDCVFYDPNKGIYRGRDEIDRIAGRDQGNSP
jgi:hypothetical protein